ncbi:hypothetical protein [Vreelandella boliviensis]|uniref:Uncharacterized protein n=1 Tax=Vreelandella boliviensis LC1 TaxID=1072583 RepID=A0A265DYG2_9GAMM|nr:hypothetical protein [Halomonas boliviensis]EHJ94346.1 hypothetical protein KUC_1304 [Halomonas boliviensis LC1]OZT74290.1 hypothetical protein CE457_09900 [Halomonas boliviensis LC1]
MMSKDFLKKAGILGVSFGLMASPLAFAQTDENTAIDENQGITADEQPMDPQSTATSHDSTDENGQHDLTSDEGDDASDMKPRSSSQSNNADFDKDDLVEENDGSN